MVISLSTNTFNKMSSGILCKKWGLYEGSYLFIYLNIISLPSAVSSFCLSFSNSICKFLKNTSTFIFIWICFSTLLHRFQLHLTSNWIDICSENQVVWCNYKREREKNQRLVSSLVQLHICIICSICTSCYVLLDSIYVIRSNL